MNFDRETVNKLSQMNRDELSKKIDEISAMLGLNPSLVKKKLGSPEELQKKLGALSESDIRRMSGKIDPETMNKLSKKLGEDNYGK